MTDQRDLVHIFAEHAAGLRYNALPEGASDAAKKTLLDTLGVSLAASGLEPAVQGVFEILDETGGKPVATVLGRATKAPALMAALGNGALAHGLDYDDLTPWGQHCSSSIVPAALAIAERRGCVTGKDMIAAIAAGQDIFARLIRHVGWKKDWNFSSAMGVFAATAAAGRIMGFDAQTMSRAFGIATMQSSGLMEMVAGQGSDLRGLYAGFSAKGAVLATLMAEKGIGGIDRTFEGPNGVFACYFGGEYNRDAILDGLGQDFQGATTLYKRWPCVGTAHSHMKAAIDIVSEQGLNPNDIAEIRLHIGDFHRLMSEPLEARRTPKTLADAKFSLPFLVSTAILRGGMSVRDFTPQGLTDPNVQALGTRISLVDAPDLNWARDLPPGRVEIVARDGRNWLLEGRDVPGSVENPMGWDAICEKFRECASVAARPPSSAAQESVIQLARELESLNDISDLMRLLS